MTTAYPRERLSLPAGAAKTSNGASTDQDRKPAYSGAQKRPGGDFNDIKEFRCLDSDRPISTYRHAVNWACPKRDNPDATLVGIRCGEKPVPL
jgi:hypothetical protein